MTNARPMSLRGTAATPDLAALLGTIEGLPILVAGSVDLRVHRTWRAPPGYDEADIRVLDWIASQRRRARPGRPAN